MGEGNEKGEEDDEDDDYIDTAQLGDWRTFRMNLAETGNPTDKKPKNASRKSVSVENEEVLRSQSKSLADEYQQGIWAHETAMVGYHIFGIVHCQRTALNSIFLTARSWWASCASATGSGTLSKLQA